ncbi:MAG: TetR/AcrR family transcriptional regulator [Jatrophihabitans sp.]
MSTPRPDMRPRRTQDQRRAQTRQSVLAAAAQVFATHGFHAATVDAVADAAGLSKGGVYYSFRSKDDLFLALLEEKISVWVTAMNATSSEGSLSNQASRAASGFFGDLDADPSWTPLFLEFLAYSVRAERAHEVVRTQFFESLHAAVAATTAQRTAAVGLRNVPVDDFAAGVGALACGLGVQKSFMPDGDADRVMAVMLELLLEGIVARSTRESS